MPQEFDNCELCGCRKSIYTDTYKCKNVCKACMKKMDELPQWVLDRDEEYRELLKRTVRCHMVVCL